MRLQLSLRKSGRRREYELPLAGGIHLRYSCNQLSHVMSQFAWTAAR